MVADEFGVKFEENVFNLGPNIMPKFLKVKFYGPLKSHFEIKKSQIQNFLSFWNFRGNFLE